MIRGINILTTSNHQIHDMDIYNHRRKFRSLEAKLPTISRPGRSSARKKLREGEDKKVRRENMQVREKVGKSRNTVFFQCGLRCESTPSWTSKVSKHVGFGPLLEVEMWKKRTPFWREAHVEVKSCKAHHARTIFGS